jgi:hypothetical protein
LNRKETAVRFSPKVVHVDRVGHGNEEEAALEWTAIQRNPRFAKFNFETKKFKTV